MRDSLITSCFLNGQLSLKKNLFKKLLLLLLLHFQLKFNRSYSWPLRHGLNLFSYLLTRRRFTLMNPGIWVVSSVINLSRKYSSFKTISGFIQGDRRSLIQRKYFGFYHLFSITFYRIIREIVFRPLEAKLKWVFDLLTSLWVLKSKNS